MTPASLMTGGQPGPVSERVGLTEYIAYMCAISRDMEQTSSEKRKPCFCESTCGVVGWSLTPGSLSCSDPGSIPGHPDVTLRR